jgi:hypothetical protein
MDLMSKLPIKRENRDLATDKGAMENRLAQLRAQRGVGERRVVQFLCSETGQPFTVALTRKSEGHLYRIDSIEAAGGGAKRGLLGRLFAVPAPAAKPFNMAELDFSGFRCPHCGHMARAGISDFFRCYCDRLQCGGRIDVLNGTTRFACHDGCGNSGTLSGRIGTVEGSSKAENARPALPNGTAAKQLQTPQKFLPGGKERGP